MQNVSLVLSIPQGIVTATSLPLKDFAWHRSPGSGKYFHGRSILVDLALKDGKPDFHFLDEGGWRDAQADTASALESVARGKRTKTALSNNGFSCTPTSAYRQVYLAKTGGQLLDLERAGNVATYTNGTCNEGMTPDEIATAIGGPKLTTRAPRLYFVFAPIEFVVLSNLTPAEYVWYATRRPGKVFRQVCFTELRGAETRLVADAVMDDARKELAASHKKTKTITGGNMIERVSYVQYVGYDREAEGGIYVGDRSSLALWRFPEKIPRAWERAD